MSLTKFTLEMLDQDVWRATSPEDVGVHVIGDDPSDAIIKARQMADDLNASRATSKRPDQ